MGEANQLQIVQEKIKGMKTLIDSTQVTNDDELAKVSDIVKQVKTLGKYIEAEKEKFVAPAKLIIKEARDKYDPYIKECDNAEIVLKIRARDYMVAQEQKKRAEEAAIAKKVEAGRLKPENAIKKIENLAPAPSKIQTMESGLKMSKKMVAKIQDANLVPDEYWVIDEVMVRKAAMEFYKAGLPQIPGVIVVEEAVMSSS